MTSMMTLGLGAFLGAIIRWQLGAYFNPLFPTLPLGTLFANLVGSFLMGAMVFLTTEHAFFSYEARLGMITGFLGSLTTFSTFSAEVLLLLSKQEYAWLWIMGVSHVGGSIGMVAAGYALTKLIFQSLGG